MLRSSGLQLDADLQRWVDELATESGISAVDVLREAVQAYAARRQNKNNRTEAEDAGTLLDAFQEAGLVGCLVDAPADLSTNEAYFEGFGRG